MTEQSAKSTSARVRIVGAVAFVAIDAFILNQGVLSVFVLLYSLLVLLPHAAYNYFFGKNGKELLIRFGAFAIPCLLVLGLNALNNSIAYRRATQLIATIEQFRSENGRLPRALDELVPRYLGAIPRAKYAIPGEFHYYADEGGATLFYIELPPFGRPTYDFEKKSWVYID